MNDRHTKPQKLGPGSVRVKVGKGDRQMGEGLSIFLHASFSCGQWMEISHGQECGGCTQCLVARRCIEVDSGLGGGSRTRSGCKGL